MFYLLYYLKASLSTSLFNHTSVDVATFLSSFSLMEDSLQENTQDPIKEELWLPAAS